MIIWVAGETGDVGRERGIIQFLPQRLLSYYFLNTEKSSRMTMKCDVENKIDLFLDSGAFSAHTQGVEINLKNYIDFIKKHKKHITTYANLDVIGDAKATLKNQRTMEKAGLNPLPCFHYGESTKYLKYYIDNYDYIALGGIVSEGSTKKLYRWLDDVFDRYICKNNGMPRCRVHGFGVTSLPILFRYPWYSVDSTSWVVTGRLGSVYVPRHIQGKYVYNEQSWKIAVSNKSPDRKEAGQHVDTFSLKQRKIFLDYFKSKGYELGKSEFKYKSVDYKLKKNEKWAEKKDKTKKERLLEIIIEDGLCNNYKLRDEINIIYFMDLEKSIPKYPTVFKLKNKTKGFGFGLV